MRSWTRMTAAAGAALALGVIFATKGTVAGNEVDEVKRIAGTSRWAGAEVEVRLWDGTRVDVLTSTHAIEADWAHKWAEAIGQSLYYAQLTNRAPGIILLVRDHKSEDRFVYRCQTVCARHGIRLWVEAVESR